MYPLSLHRNLRPLASPNNTLPTPSKRYLVFFLGQRRVHIRWRSSQYILSGRGASIAFLCYRGIKNLISPQPRQSNQSLISLHRQTFEFPSILASSSPLFTPLYPPPSALSLTKSSSARNFPTALASSNLHCPSYSNFSSQRTFSTNPCSAPYIGPKGPFAQNGEW